jgi:disulfide bond formation protein DsbB
MKKISDFFCQQRNLGLLVAAASAGAIGFAWTLQYGFNKLPCPLCYYQRYPYFANIAIGLLAVVLAKTSPRLAFLLLLLAATVFTASAGVAVFHIGVEHGWWEGLSTCGAGIGPPANATIEELKEYFKNTPIVDCRVPGWSLLGVSMTEQNFLYSLFLSFFTFFHAIKGRKRN